MAKVHSVSVVNYPRTSIRELILVDKRLAAGSGLKMIVDTDYNHIPITTDY